MYNPLRRRQLARAVRWATAAIVTTAALSPTPVRADQVVLKNGDTLTGHVTTLDAGKLTINVLGLGDVKVDLDQVATFGTDGPVALHRTDGTIIQRRILPTTTTGPTTSPTTSPTTAPTPGTVVLDGGMIPSPPTPVADVGTINPAEPKIYAGSITAGALLIRGNAVTETLNLGVNVARKTDQDTIAFVGSYLYGRTRDRTTGITITTAENWQVDGRYDYNFTPRFYAFADALARKDRLAFLDLRLVPSLGLGYRFFTGPDFTLAGELGGAWVYENFTNGTPTREDFSGRAAYHLTYKFNDAVSAFHDTDYLQSVQRGRNFLITTDVGVRAKLTEHFFGEAKVTLIHDSSPANGALKNDVFYAVSLGYNL